MQRIPRIASTYLALAMLTFAPLTVSAQQGAAPADSVVCARMKSWMQPYLADVSMDTTPLPRTTLADSTRYVFTRMVQFGLAQAMSGKPAKFDLFGRLSDSSRAAVGAAITAGKLDKAKSLLEATLPKSGTAEEIWQAREEWGLAWSFLIVMPDTLRRDFATMSLQKPVQGAGERQGCMVAS